MKGAKVSLEPKYSTQAKHTQDKGGATRESEFGASQSEDTVSNEAI